MKAVAMGRRALTMCWGRHRRSRQTFDRSLDLNYRMLVLEGHGTEETETREKLLSKLEQEP